MASCDLQSLGNSQREAEEPVNDNDSQPTVQVDDSQHQVLGDLNGEPASAGGEEAVSETQLEITRPRLVKTPQSLPSDTDLNTFTKTDSVTPETVQEQPIDVNAPAIETRLIIRPKSAGEAKIAGFSFGNPGQAKMDFKGTRKGPVSNTPTRSGTPAETPFDNTSVPAYAGDHEVTYNVQTPHPGSARDDYAESDRTVSQSNEPLVQVSEGSILKKKHKGQKKRRYKTAPEAPAAHHDPATTVESVEDESAREAFEIIAAAQTGGSAASEPQHLDNQPDMEIDVPAAEDKPVRAISPRAQISPQGEEEENRENEDAVLNTASPSAQLQVDSYAEEAAGQRSPMPRSASLRSLNQRHARGNSSERDTSQVLHQVSTANGSSRVTKPKSKRSRKAMTPAVVGGEIARDPTSEVNDYLQIAWYKLAQLPKYYEAQSASEREKFQAEMQQVVKAKDTMQDRFNAVVQEKETLKTATAKQHVTLNGYKSKINTFRAFVEGLGNDVDAIKKDANAYRRICEGLALEAQDNRSEREAMLADIKSYAERSTEIKAKISKVSDEIQDQLRDAHRRGDYLEQRLSDNVGMLTEERDRRSQLENQLGQKLASITSSDQKVEELLEGNKNAVLARLSEISATFQRDGGSNGMSDMLQQTLAAVQALASQAGTTKEDIASAKGLIEKVNESVAEHLHVTTSTAEETIASAFQARLDQALSTLRDELSHREAQNQQDAAHHEQVKTLQEKLKECDTRITKADLQVVHALESERLLNEEKSKLHATIAGLQTKVSTTANVQVQLNEAKAELQETARTLESTNANLTKKADELRNLTASNESLQEQVHRLQSRLDEIPDPVADFTSERRELQKRAEADVELVRKEMAEHAEKYEAEMKTKTSNELKRLTSERNRLEKQLKTTTQELSDYKSRIQNPDTAQGNGDAAKDQDFERLKNLTQSQKQEIKTLQVSVNNLQNSAKSDMSLKKDYSALVAQFESERKKSLQTNEEKSTLLRQIEGLQAIADQANLARDQAKSELDEFQVDNERTIGSLEEDLAKEKEAAKRSAAGREQLKKSCDEAIEDERKKCERRIKDLQERLSDAQGEAQEKEEASRKFHEQVQQSWQAHQQDHQARISELELKIIDADTKKDEALQSKERLRQDLQKAMDEERHALTQQLHEAEQRATSAENKLTLQQQPSGEAPNIVYRLSVPKLAGNITPTGSVQSKAPKKLRRMIHSKNSSTHKDGSVAPRDLRSDSLLFNSTINDPEERGPVVEESEVVSGHSASNLPRHAEQALTSGPAGGRPGSDDMLSIVDGGLRFVPQTVEETQSQEPLPLFATFNEKLIETSHSLRSRATSPASPLMLHNDNGSLATPDHNMTRDGNHRGSIPKIASRTSQKPQASFTLYERAQEGDDVAQPAESGVPGESRDASSASRAEMYDNSYHKTFPQPNSASKIVRRERNVSDKSRRRSSTPYGMAPQERDFDGPELRAGSATSSTPSWVRGEKGRKANADYTQRASGGKHRFSGTQVVPNADPRLAHRNPPLPPKRKPENQIVHGYEQERKKRLTSAAAMAAGETRTAHLRSHAQPNGASDLPTMPAGPASSQHQYGGQTGQPRKRNLGGGNARASRGAKKPMKSDEFSARFSDAVNGR